MSSSSLVSNRYFDKLAVNRLQAQQIKTDKTYPERPEYLYSAVLSNATFDRTNTGGTLTFLKSDVKSVIEFTDRPLRKTNDMSTEAFIDLFTRLTGNDTFTEDPPNMVLNHAQEQRTYKMILDKNKTENETVMFELELLPGEVHNLNSITGEMNMFVDGDSSDSSDINSSLIPTNIGPNSIKLTLPSGKNFTGRFNFNLYHGSYADGITYVIDFSNANLSSCTLSGSTNNFATPVNLSHAILQNMNLKNESLDFQRADLSNADFTGSSFRVRNLSNNLGNYVFLRDAILTNTIFDNVQFSGPLESLNFYDIDLSSLDLSRVSLNNANLTNVTLPINNLPNTNNILYYYGNNFSTIYLKTNDIILYKVYTHTDSYTDSEVKAVIDFNFYISDNVIHILQYATSFNPITIYIETKNQYTYWPGENNSQDYSAFTKKSSNFELYLTFDGTNSLTNIQIEKFKKQHKIIRFAGTVLNVLNTYVTLSSQDFDNPHFYKNKSNLITNNKLSIKFRYVLGPIASYKFID